LFRDRIPALSFTHSSVHPLILSSTSAAAAAAAGAKFRIHPIVDAVVPFFFAVFQITGWRRSPSGEPPS
jgi:hypothetical protein